MAPIADPWETVRDSSEKTFYLTQLYDVNKNEALRKSAKVLDLIWGNSR